jgi:GTPase
VGKSTLISRISAARPKIADYPFTTLEPNLGVVTIGELPDEQSYVVADIPGLIEGAHEGSGLGTQFLRHIERTRVLAHVIDVSDASGRPDPVEDFKVIMTELESFGADLQKKPMMVIASKMDVANPDKLAKLRKHCKKVRLDLYEISAVTGAGIPELKYALGNRLAEIRDGVYQLPKPARKKAVAPRKARKVQAKRPTTPASQNRARRGPRTTPASQNRARRGPRIPKRAAFKKRKAG